MVICDVEIEGPTGLPPFTSGKTRMSKVRCVYPHLLWFLIFLTSLLLAACGSAPEAWLAVTPIAPRKLPGFLEDIYPSQGDILSMDDYEAKICVQVDACEAIGEGDFWDFEDVYTRTTILVDNQPTGGRIGAVEDYMVGCYVEDSQGNELMHTGGPYKWCVCTPPIAAGVHQIDLNFERSDGEVLSFSWTFTLVHGPVPTPTPLPAPVEVDQVGHLPDYIKAVYPWPGEELLISPSKEEWQEVLDSMGMPDSVQLASLNKLPVCFSLIYPEVLELGTLPTHNNFLDRIYFSVDGITMREGLYRSAYNNYLGVETSPQCFETPLIPGKHTATVYVDPFDAELVIYSWAFVIEEH